jgi:ABC-type nitrate/sulfonate/bicarbonate transport system permease component
MLSPLRMLTALGRGIFALIVAALVWEIAALCVGNEMLVPDLGTVIGSTIDLYSKGSFWGHAWSSAQRFLAGYGAAVIIGIPVGLALGRIKAVRLTLGSLVSGLAAAPLAVLAPLTTFWWGADSAAKVSLAFVAAVFPLMNKIMTGLAGAEPHSPAGYRVTRCILAGLRVAIVPATVAVVVAEMLASVSGLGLMLMNAAGLSHVSWILAVFLIISLPVIVLTHILRSIETRLAADS